jgi:hypothetical protein
MNSLRRAVPLPDSDRYLRITTNSQARYEDVMGETYLEGAARLARGSVKRVRAILYVGLLHEPGITLEKAGDLIDDLGLMEAIRLAADAMKAANPELIKDNAGNASEAAGTDGTTLSASGKRG